MIVGLDLFKAAFSDFEGSYVLIGGVACDLAMKEAELAFHLGWVSARVDVARVRC